MTIKSLSRQIAGGFGYFWGVFLAVAVLVLFVGLDSWSLKLSQLPFMKIHPRYAGGEVAEVIEEGEEQWIIHQPVFDGLIASRKRGFVQVDIVYAGESTANLERIIDYDRDNEPDFLIRLQQTDSVSPEVITYSEGVEGLDQWARTSSGWIVRVGISNK